MLANTIIINSNDNVGIAIKDLQQGEEAVVKTDSGYITVPLSQAIPYGHKVSIRSIKKSDHIIKYGESIGAATDAINKGEHVHTHNLESLRGRGDLC